MSQGIIFAVFGAIAFGLWTVFHQRASSLIDNLFGAIIVSLTAVILGVILILPRLKTISLFSDSKGILFAVLAGICALGIDYFALRSYGTGLPISIAGPIIIGGSIVVAATIGFFLGESVTFTKILGLFFVLVGGVILASLSK